MLNWNYSCVRNKIIVISLYHYIVENDAVHSYKK